MLTLSLLDFAIIAAIVFLAAGSCFSAYRQPRESARLYRLEAKLDLLLKNASLAYDPQADVPPGVLDAIRRDQKLEAVKLYRDGTGVSLMDAKRAVEELQANRKV